MDFQFYDLKVFWNKNLRMAASITQRDMNTFWRQYHNWSPHDASNTKIKVSFLVKEILTEVT